MSTGYRQRRKATLKVWKERALGMQQHGALIARLVNAFMLERKGEAIVFSAELLEKTKAINVRINAQPDGGLELVVVTETVSSNIPAGPGLQEIE